MPNVNRRTFVLASLALPVACAMRAYASDLPAGPAAQTVPRARSPIPGQSWRYAKRDGFTGEFLTVQVDRVAAVDRVVTIESRTESDEGSAQPGVSSANTDWLNPYRRGHRSASSLPSEIQQPWGMVLVDPHWDLVQVYKTPIPLWPTRLQPGWCETFYTQYATVDAAGLPWQLTMRAHGWDSITVPAGRFTALRFTNLINFTHSDFGWVNGVRRETVWFAPEVGRWVARESSGTYYIDDSVIDQPFNENRYRLELLAWV